MQAWAYVLSGETRRGKTALDRAKEITAATDQEFSRAYGSSILASIHQATEHPPAVTEYASQALELSRQHKFRYWEAWAQILRGWATAASGAHDRGIEELMAGLESYTQTGSKQIVLYAKTLLADAYLRAGRTLSALTLIEEIESTEETSPVRFHRPITDRVARDLRAASKAGEGGAKA
jgi:hypothetical protein